MRGKKLAAVVNSFHFWQVCSKHEANALFLTTATLDNYSRMLG